ncbi:MAG: LamG domain-containing protein, partial [Sedimentisphaerales bacterium]|nr:LamG domain-containing protein [Sedimentisphaerales bacterium]
TGELLVRWQFNETSGTIASDTSGKGHHGDVNDVNGVSWVNDAERGRCLDFAGGDYVLDNDANTYLNGLHGLTMCVWVKNRNTAANDRGFIIFEDPAGNDDRDMRYDAAGANGDPDGISVIKCGVTTTSPVGQPIQQIESSEYAQTTAWQHLALTWSTGEQLKLYINGVLDTPTANRPGTYGVTTGATKLIVGKGGKDNAVDLGWNGLIDDVQIYNYALSPAEITTVRNGGAIAPKPVHYPVPSSAEIYEGEAQGGRVINFKDYTELMDNWLLEIKYPQ